jgi:hypothetical protein
MFSVILQRSAASVYPGTFSMISSNYRIRDRRIPLCFEKTLDTSTGYRCVKLFREPLLHFLIAGALLFGGYEWLHRGEPVLQTEKPVRIGDGEIGWLRETFANQWHREPTGEEMHGLLATLLEEDLLAREARSLGLDQNDTIVRRRLAQKLTFLVEDTSRIADPSEDELRRFYAAHAERYRTDPLVSFSHIFFSPERRPHADADARAALALVSTAGGQVEKLPDGDRLLLESSFDNIGVHEVSSLFGPDFTRAIFALPPGSWSGPVRSAFGLHLVQVTELRRAELRPFDDVRDTVLVHWRRQWNSETKRAYLARLRDKYGVVIDDSVRTILERVPTPPAGP